MVLSGFVWARRRVVFPAARRICLALGFLGFPLFGASKATGQDSDVVSVAFIHAEVESKTFDSSSGKFRVQTSFDASCELCRFAFEGSFWKSGSISHAASLDYRDSMAIA